MTNKQSETRLADLRSQSALCEEQADAREDREDRNASSGTVCCVAELDSVCHGVVVETELAIKD